MKREHDVSNLPNFTLFKFINFKREHLAKRVEIDDSKQHKSVSVVFNFDRFLILDVFQQSKIFEIECFC